MLLRDILRCQANFSTRRYPSHPPPPLFSCARVLYNTPRLCGLSFDINMPTSLVWVYCPSCFSFHSGAWLIGLILNTSSDGYPDRFLSWLILILVDSYPDQALSWWDTCYVPYPSLAMTLEGGGGGVVHGTPWSNGEVILYSLIYPFSLSRYLLMVLKKTFYLRKVPKLHHGAPNM